MRDPFIRFVVVVGLIVVAIGLFAAFSDSGQLPHWVNVLVAIALVLVGIAYGIWWYWRHWW